jgi:PTS system nitrogen regulatory IIA component
MIPEYQLTFFVDNVSASAHAAQPLCRLARKFKSAIRIINITQGRTVDFFKSVALL